MRVGGAGKTTRQITIVARERRICILFIDSAAIEQRAYVYLDGRRCRLSNVIDTVQRCPGFTSKIYAFRRKTDYNGAFAERFDCELGRLSWNIQISIVNNADTSDVNNSEFHNDHFDNTEFVARGDSRGLRRRYSPQYDYGKRGDGRFIQQKRFFRFPPPPPH